MRIAQNGPHKLSGDWNLKFGVLCGIEREAAIVREALQGQSHDILCSGAVAENAMQAASALVEGGATHLISFGLAGALDDQLKPGDLLLPASVIDAGDNFWQVDEAWRMNVTSRVPEAHADNLLGVDKPARTGAQKLFLRNIHNAIAVDMESHFIARAASQGGLPFLVIRVIADDSRTSLPQAAMSAISPDGKEQPLKVMRALIRHPGETGDLIRLGLASGKAFRTLSRVAGLALRF